MSKKRKKARLISAAVLSGALAITLSSCSGATNTYGKLDSNKVYAEAGKYQVTTGELWDELKWSAKDVIDSQKETIVLNDSLKKVDIILNSNGDISKLSDEDKDKLKTDYDDDGTYEEITADSLSKLYIEFKEDMINFIIQDFLSTDWKAEGYWKTIESYTDLNLLQLYQKYDDKMFTTYHKNEITADLTNKGKKYSELIKAAVDDYKDNDFENDTTKDAVYEIALDLKEEYYPKLAKLSYAYDAAWKDYYTKLSEDEDEDDDTFGSFTKSQFVSELKTAYTDTFDLDQLLIKFTDSTEFSNTLRAFGIYLYSSTNTYYFIKDTDSKDYTKASQTYKEYIEYYDKMVKKASSTMNPESNQAVIKLDGKVMLDIYVMLYNYMYGGYRSILPAGVLKSKTYDEMFPGLNMLRDTTYEIIYKYQTSDEDALYNQTLSDLNGLISDQTYNDYLVYDAKTLKDNYNDTFRRYCYDTLKLKDDNDNQSYSTRYSTALQSSELGSFIVYKFADASDDIDESSVSDMDISVETLKACEGYYQASHTTNEYYEFITENKELYNSLLNILVKNTVSSSTMTTAFDKEVKNVAVKVYVEEVEIAYLLDNSDYSKTIFKADNNNLLATLEYNGTTYNLNIKADEEDQNSIKVRGTNKAFGVFDYLEQKDGATTAITLISNKIIKDTSVFKEERDKKSNRQLYENYIKNVLTAFANDAYSSNGYPATVGTYNFLMSYFHSADIDEIIDNYYILSLASAKLLTNYASTSLSDFIKEYSDIAYDSYFNLSGKRLLVYLDMDDDNKADKVEDWKDITVDWTNTETKVNNPATTLEEVAKNLVIEIYNRLSYTANTSHATELETIVNEINNSAKAQYSESPSSPEETWAKYKKLGFNVKLEDVSLTNSSSDVDFKIKQRVYDYSRGHDSKYEETNGAEGYTYQYFINESSPTEYIEPLSKDSISTSNNEIVESSDGYNLIVITSCTTKSSAKWSIEDYEETPLTDIVIKFNEEYYKIKNIFNEEDKFSSNQVLLYLLDMAVNNGSSILMPQGISSAVSSFLSPVYTRFQGTETQRIILLYFIKKAANVETSNIYNIIKFNSEVTYNNEAYDSANGYLNEIISINQRSADSYKYIFIDDPNSTLDDNLNLDTTNTLDLYPNWWEKLEEKIADFLINTTKEEK